MLAAVGHRLDGPRSATGGHYLKPWDDGAVVKVPIAERPPLRSIVQTPLEGCRDSGGDPVGSQSGMNVLVLTPEPIGAEQLRDALSAELEPADTQVMVIAPALHESPLKFWLSDADEAIAKADRVQRDTLEQLDNAGVPAAADTAEGDPLEAIEDALQTFPADRIVLFKHPEDAQRYREDVDPSELERRFGVPVDPATV